jgi:hypothetical protein
MTPRPKKKEYELDEHAKPCHDDELWMAHNSGFNECYDEFEKYLPSEEEIALVINKYLDEELDIMVPSKIGEELAQAISKRIRE